MTITRTMGPKAWAMLLVLAVVWGGSFTLNAVAGHFLPALTIVFLRVGGATLVLWALVMTLGLRSPRGIRQWRDLACMGLFNNAIPFTLIVWGQQEIASGLAAILNATTPFFALMFAHLMTRDERLAGLRLAGVATGLVGVAAMIGFNALEEMGSHVAGQVAVVGAAVSYGLAAVFGRRLAVHPPLVTAAGQTLGSTLLLLPLVIVIDRPWTLAPPPLAAVAAVVGLAVACTAFAYVLYFSILKAAGAGNVSLVTFLIPPVSVLLGVLWLDERLAVQHVAGMAVIALGLVLIDGRLIAALRPRPAPRSAP